MMIQKTVMELELILMNTRIAMLSIVVMISLLKLYADILLVDAWLNRVTFLEEVIVNCMITGGQLPKGGVYVFISCD